jgi:hypothetical protein
MFVGSSTRRNTSLIHSKTGRNNVTTMASNDSSRNTNTGFGPTSPTRKVRTRATQRQIKRRQNNILGTIIVVITLTFVAIGIINNSNVDYYHKRMIRAETETKDNENGRNKNLREGDEERDIWVSQESQPFDKNGLASKAEHLVMVAGHSVTVSGHLKDAGSDEKDWFLLSYQKGQGLPQAIQAHIVAGIEEARKDPKALLIFSGGETRAVSGPQTEAQAYYHVADAMKLWPSGNESSVRARTTTEEFATDSFENLMFSIARFREVTGKYPQKITVVSFSFKRRRFETLHAPALRWPSDRFVYVGVDPPASTGFDLARSTEGESKNAATPFETDPYGCHSEVLQEKRKGRNPFKRTPPYGLSCPEMKALLGFCGPQMISDDQVPWANRS